MVRKTIFLALMALILVLSVSVSVLAGPVLDTDRLCKLTVSFQKDQEPISGGSVICTCVGYVYDDGISVRYRRVLDHADMINLQDPDTAHELERFVNQNNITGTIKNVDSNGKVEFADLAPGVYLIRQKNAPDGYLPIKPFLVTLPYLKDGEYIYDVDASAKTELDKEPTESTEPTEPSTGPTEPSTGPTEPTKPTEPGGGDSPQTGQLNWPIPVMAILGIFCLCLGMYFSSKGKKEVV